MTILAVVFMAAAAVPPAKTEAPTAAARNVPTVERVRALLDATGAAKHADLMADQMITQFKSTMSMVPEGVWDEMRAAFDVEEMIDITIPVYQKHLSAEDVESAITYWRSETGQRFRDAQPAIMTESMQLGSAWGRKKAQEIFEKLERRGFKPGMKG